MDAGALKLFSYVVLAAAALATLIFVRALMPATASAATLLGAWLLLPYVLLALAIRFLAKASTRTYSTIAIATAIGGIGFLTYVIYLRPDPQGAIAVIFTPLYQLVGMIVLFPICGWLFAKRG
jgi:hypothetical protein